MTDFGENLVRRGIISPDQLAEAEQVAKESGSSVADSLVRLGYATGEDVMRAIAEIHKLDYVPLAEIRIKEASPTSFGVTSTFRSDEPVLTRR